MKKYMTILVAIILQGCSDSGVPPTLNERLTAISNSGQVSVCSSESQDGEFAFQIDTVAITMSWWSMANGVMESRSRGIYQVNSGRAGTVGGLIYYHQNYQPEYRNRETMATAGVLSDRYGLSIRDTDPLIVVGNYNRLIGTFDLFYCSTEEFSTAQVDGVLIAN